MNDFWSGARRRFGLLEIILVVFVGVLLCLVFSLMCDYGSVFADDKYYAHSNVSNRGSYIATNSGLNDYYCTVSYGIAIRNTIPIKNDTSKCSKISEENGDMETAAADVTIDKYNPASGDSADLHLTYSHNIYYHGTDPENNSNNPVGYKVLRTVTKDGEEYQGFNSLCAIGKSNDAPCWIDNSNAGKDSYKSGEFGYEHTGNAYFSKTAPSGVSNDLYAIGDDFYAGRANPKGTRLNDYMDGPSSDYRYILRDYYKVFFNKPGKYEFCETVHIKDSGTDKYWPKTSVCSSVKVKITVFYNITNTVEATLNEDTVNPGESVTPSIVARAKKTGEADIPDSEKNNVAINLITFIADSNTGKNRSNVNEYVIEKSYSLLKSPSGHSSSSYEVPDAGAGKYFCVEAKISPYVIGTDKDNNDSGWYTQSSPSCAEITGYNITNTVEAEMGDVVYAGEVAGLKNAKFYAQKSGNSKPDSSVKNKVEIKVAAYVADSREEKCGDVGSWSESSSECMLVYSETKDSFVPSDNDEKEKALGISGFNVPDERAGKYFCVRIAISPHVMGTNKKNNENGWYIHQFDCALIAKKPSFQVWGGNVYTAGNVKTFVSEKRNVVGRNNYVPNDGKVTAFGSWAELGIIHKGTVSGLASGNAIQALTGSGETDHCKRSPLTISNECSNDMIKENGNIVDPGDREIITEYFAGNSNITKKGGTSLEAGDYISLEAGDYIIKQGTTIFYNSEGGDFTIDNNIEYADGPYSDPKEIPKLIIYAKNIKIACGVSRIDAILIAEGTISTCSDGAKGNYNDSKRSKQITINGAIIAKKIDLGRTYGAATGENSGIPAEIINYDSSIYLRAASGLVWSDVISGSGGTSGVKYDNLIKQTDMVDLPPRY